MTALERLRRMANEANSSDHKTAARARRSLAPAAPALLDLAEAVQRWRDAECAGITARAPSSDFGFYGCRDGEGSNHAEACPVEVARVAVFAASQKLEAL